MMLLSMKRLLIDGLIKNRESIWLVMTLIVHKTISLLFLQPEVVKVQEL